MRHRWLPSRLKWIIPPSGLLRGVWWFQTDVSKLPIGPVFKDSLTLEERDKQNSQNMFQTTLRRVITQKTEEFKARSIFNKNKSRKRYVWTEHKLDDGVARL